MATTTAEKKAPRLTPLWLVRWFDNHAKKSQKPAKGIDWLQAMPFIGMHVACLAVFWVGWSWAAVGTAVALYFLRMFFITGFYHRYFSHRTFRTSRWFQAAMAVAGCCAVQRDPVWWASQHAHHHAYSDGPEDPHSPRQLGFWRAHVGWVIDRASHPTRDRYVQDWIRFPELRFLNRFDLLPPILLAFAVFGWGILLETYAPSLGVDRWQMLVWGFFVSTVALYHGTFTVNSLAHVFGNRRYATKDDSRNNWLIALITLGEGWHNNHHHYPSSTRQGFFWWEIDITYYGLLTLSRLGLIWDLRSVPERALGANRAS